MSRKLVVFSIALFFVPLGMTAQEIAKTNTGNTERGDDRLIFQTSQPWTARTNIDAGAAMVYGIGPRMLPNLQSWREHAYIGDVMTGVAWGSYQDYLEGHFDGHNHMDQAQMDSTGNKILHGGNASVPYISPGNSYGRYLSQGVRRALDAGVQSVFLEEPEFWARSGWEDNFKREWKAFYGEEWQAPNSSVDAQYRASKLKYFLYRRALGQVFDAAKEYGRENGRTIRCYVATHSLINYANWRIVSPESSLLAVGADGYIAQVWTGTARTPNYYNGIRKERTFETAFLEYGSMQNLARASGRPIWYLNDPIEDDPNHDWDDYRANWESTLTASLLQPDVWRYEIMPWPERVFNSQHPIRTVTAINKSIKELEQTPVGTGLGGFGPEPAVERTGIPKAYETELQSVIRALGDMKQENVEWLEAGTKNVGILVSDTMMFERADPFSSDAALGSFYGLALPLVTHGVPAEPAQIESATTPGFLDHFKILLLTYEGQKPPKPEFHDVLAQWVRNGGALVVVDNDDDPYNGVREWWNAAPNSYKTPREDLFARLGISEDATGVYRAGRGIILSDRESPASLTHGSDGGEIVRRLVRRAAEAIHLRWTETSALVLRRGPYLVASGLDESIPAAAPYVIHGRFVNLFDPNLAVLTRAELAPNSRMLLVDLDRMKRDEAPHVIAASCRLSNERSAAGRLTFDMEGIADTNAVIRITASRRPAKLIAGGVAVPPGEYEMSTGTLLIRLQNSTSPMQVEIDMGQ